MADQLTLTIRLYDPTEKRDSSMAASWVTVKVEREDLAISADDFVAKYVKPNLSQISQLKLT